jgi:hydroxymethylpyrimidine/phosphomethylpyrimidine kinase
MITAPPVVLSLSGHDPTGGAGIQADIETCVRLGCHPCTVVTALTVQDTRNVRRVIPQAAEDFLEQARAVLADLPVAAIKIGLLGSVEIVRAVAEILEGAGEIPVVLDPILAAGGGRNLATEELIGQIRARLIPRATVLTPNTPEARKLAGKDDPETCARELLALGCPNVLLTGTHEDGPDVANRWYSAAGVETCRWPRLPGSYHGSGCTLASAVAACLARGCAMEAAVRKAQRFTWEALQGGFHLGRGQLLPNRMEAQPRT